MIAARRTSKVGQALSPANRLFRTIQAEPTTRATIFERGHGLSRADVSVISGHGLSRASVSVVSGHGFSRAVVGSTKHGL